jgi:hypothetical protein
MSDEIPEANEPLTADELSAIAKLSDADLQIIDAAILANSSARWLKVARVATFTADVLRHSYPAFSPTVYAERLAWLVEQGRLESQGKLDYMRFSEVRIPAQPAKA